jgi:hypothetical protein
VEEASVFTEPAPEFFGAEVVFCLLGVLAKDLNGQRIEVGEDAVAVKKYLFYSLV